PAPTVESTPRRAQSPTPPSTASEPHDASRSPFLTLRVHRRSAVHASTLHRWTLRPCTLLQLRDDRLFPIAVGLALQAVIHRPHRNVRLDEGPRLLHERLQVPRA